MIGIGLDVVELDRFRQTMKRTPTFGRRVFTEAEVEYSERRRDQTERYAVRFAAKEAVLKAMGLGLWNCSLTEIEVIRADSGEPSIRLHGAAAELAAARGIEAWHLTLTHTETAAHAIAIAFGTSGPSLRVRIAAADRSASIAFYEDVLGFARISRGDADVLALGTAVIELVLGAGTGAKTDLVLEVPDVRVAWDRAVRHRPDTGALVDGCFSVVDPDGNDIRITAMEGSAS